MRTATLALMILALCAVSYWFTRSGHPAAAIAPVVVAAMLGRGIVR